MLKDKLPALRKQAGLTQKELAEKLNITRSSLSLYELGRRDPDTATLKQIATFFNVSVDYLLDNQPSPTPEITELPDNFPFKVDSRTKKQWKELLEKGGQAFFYNDEVDEEDKKEMLDILTEFFIDAKVKNKVKYGRKKKKENEVKDHGGNTETDNE